jgi:hypothetical protein
MRGPDYHGWESPSGESEFAGLTDCAGQGRGCPSEHLQSHSNRSLRRARPACSHKTEQYNEARKRSQVNHDAIKRNHDESMTHRQRRQRFRKHRVHKKLRRSMTRMTHMTHLLGGSCARSPSAGAVASRERAARMPLLPAPGASRAPRPLGWSASRSSQGRQPSPNDHACSVVRPEDDAVAPRP